MRTRNVAIISSAFVLLGIIMLVLGAAMMILSTRYINPNDTYAVVLRIGGRIACVTGGILIVSTLSTCLYLCIIGAQYNITYRPEYTFGGNQITKVIQPPRPRLNLTSVGTNAQGWIGNEKLGTFQTLSRSMCPKGFLPSGDIVDLKRVGRDEECRSRAMKMSLGPLETNNWSNSAQLSCPRLGIRRRGHSADSNQFGLNYIPTLSSQPIMAPFNVSDFNLDHRSPRRLWMPNLNNQNTSTLTQAPRTEYGTSHLIGSTLEPLGTMLYTGGRVKLGALI